jgi:hypothetical protein
MGTSTNTKRAAATDVVTVEDGVEDAATHAVVEEVVEAVGKSNHKSHPLA